MRSGEVVTGIRLKAGLCVDSDKPWALYPHDISWSAGYLMGRYRLFWRYQLLIDYISDVEHCAVVVPKVRNTRKTALSPFFR
jgi:hypothetical protein